MKQIIINGKSNKFMTLPNLYLNNRYNKIRTKVLKQFVLNSFKKVNWTIKKGGYGQNIGQKWFKCFSLKGGIYYSGFK